MKKHHHQSFVLWFTGLSGSGKTTLSCALEKELRAREVMTVLLDGDRLREGLSRDLGFSEEDRKENIRRAGEVAKLFVDEGIVALTALISPYREDRDRARALVEKDAFIEIHVKCSLQVCRQRDPKGLYRKADKGEVWQFTGVDDPYEVPLEPEIVVETDHMTVEECVSAITGYLESRGLI